ncbi:uncharacterized protein LOC113782552 [Coffea eugenioides]|uniref:Protein S40-1-like n=1 Tax=Coffea arabica TaxID=13443 RepID=A0ABM4VSR7_COFAR|nr:uncharacterized protein LOC113782552 [Coffea eugenioides]
MAEEFQESEVIFQEIDGSEDNEEYYIPMELNSRELRKISNPKRKKLKTKKNTSASLPVSIPESFSGNNSCFRSMESDFNDDDDGDDGEMEPPHVIIGRRITRKVMAFSVCTGNGRTLKGRDLSEVRNSILRMTGFLET